MFIAYRHFPCHDVKAVIFEVIFGGTQLTSHFKTYAFKMFTKVHEL